jgi:Transposase IS116/IS110/IS902 family
VDDRRGPQPTVLWTHSHAGRASRNRPASLNRVNTRFVAGSSGNGHTLVGKQVVQAPVEVVSGRLRKPRLPSIGSCRRSSSWPRVLDFQRFRRPPTHGVGLVPSEDSSGDTQRRGALTKAGNSHARRVLVKAAWHYRHRPTIGRSLASRSEGQPHEIVGQRVASATALAPPLPSSRRPRQATAGGRGGKSRANWWGSSGPP